MHVNWLGKAFLGACGVYMLAKLSKEKRELWEIPEAQARYAELLKKGCTPEQAGEFIVMEFS